MRQPPTEDLAPWFLTLPDLGNSLDWPTFFGNDQPVELDVGCGRGLFLVNAALADPRTNFCGLEIDYREGRRTARRLKKRAMANARVLGGDARIALDQLIAPSSVSAIHVYFPDPWWKRKHRRRRIFTDEFLGFVTRVLVTGGELYSRSDVGEYFETIRVLVSHHGNFQELTTPELHQPEHEMDYLTSYERKGRQAGSEIHCGHWRYTGE